MAALSNFITCFFGWKNTYLLTGVLGLGMAGVGFSFLKEPEVGQFDPDRSVSMNAETAAIVADEGGSAAIVQETAVATEVVQEEEESVIDIFKGTLSELSMNDTAKWVLAGSCVKQVSEFTIAPF